MKKFLNLLIISLATFIVYSIIEALTQTFFSDVCQTVLVMSSALYVLDKTIVDWFAKQNKNNNHNNI